MSSGIRAVGPGLDAIDKQLDAIADVNGYTTAAAASVDEHLAATIAAGTDPGGKAWPVKQDGSKALRNAKKAVTVRSAGRSVIVELNGVETFHHYGAAGMPVRTIIPKDMDEKLGNAIRRGVVTGFEAKKRGA
jgi:hypothetical protein